MNCRDASPKSWEAGRQNPREEQKFKSKGSLLAESLLAERGNSLFF